MKRRFTALAIASSLTLGACGAAGSAAPSSADTTSRSPTTISTPVTTEDRATTDATSSVATVPQSDRAEAPDFSLELANGETFSLSEGTKPVYLVFWAEW